MNTFWRATVPIVDRMAANALYSNEQTPQYWKPGDEIRQKYFMITSSEKSNLLSDYQYIVKLHNSQDSNQTDYEYKIRFADKSGHIETFKPNNEKLANSYLDFHHSLTQIGMSPIDPTEIAYIELDQYASILSFNILSSILNYIKINQIEIIGLTSRAFPVESSAYIVRYCRNEGQEYQNKNVRFEKC